MANTPNPSTKATKATAPAAATPEPEHSSKLPPAAETTEPSTEDGARTVLQTDDTAVIVDSPPLAGGADGQGRRECVVPGDRHMGAAVPGSLVCSYHTMHYDTAGKLRTTKETLPDGTEPKKEDKAA
jgi:hypothetical protein